MYIYVFSCTSLTVILPFSLLVFKNSMWAGRPFSGAFSGWPVV